MKLELEMLAPAGHDVALAAARAGVDSSKVPTLAERIAAARARTIDEEKELDDWFKDES